MDSQRTLRRAISCAGIGLHSGRKVGLTLKPAPAGHGIRFQRVDLNGAEIPASVEYVRGVSYATGLAHGEARVETVEHLLAALVSQGVDNVLVELSQPEVPIMDGSAAPFIYLIQEAGTRKLAASRRVLKVRRPVRLEDGDKQMALYPADGFRVTYTISFDHPLIRQQSRTIDLTPDVFAEEIAPARTFGFLKEVEMLRQRGLALGGSLDNAVVLGETGPLNTLRFDDEFVRHKILDAVGDLALVGAPLCGHLVVERGGHALHTAFGRHLLAEADAWDYVDAPVDVRVPVGVAVGPAVAG
ncbi:MAG: UDP-3-O-acyl-N-acetylglucosamine deacetylase [Vicinamibacteraceae bacterium]|nr:UDP-3-O-acyl-N-acetylglucosamine deacetylase [Vicinamibacteraceae bacterium]